MKFFKDHADAITTIVTVLGVFIWIHSQLVDLEKNIASLEKDIAVIKTVLIVKNIYPDQMTKEGE